MHAWGVKTSSPPIIELLPDELCAASALLQHQGVGPQEVKLAVHAGTGGKLHHKQWPESHYAAFLDQVCKRGIRPILLGGPDEVPVYASILRQMERSGAPIVLAGKTNLRETAALIALCEGAFGNDSGIMHVAAAVGTPTYVLFGPTSENRTAPYAAKQVIVAPELACRPCFDHSPFGCGAPVCMSRISVRQAVEAVLRDPRLSSTGRESCSPQS
jgi:ADP-heptose:LPS heptosyltransferase